jgi:HK97 family phage major capsid protein
LRQASTFLAAGPRIYDTAAPLRLPRISADASVGFVAEGATIPTDDVDFDEITLMPSDRTSLKVITKFTNEMLRQSVLGLDQALRTALVSAVATQLDSAMYTGAGTSNSITGLINQSGVQTSATFDKADLSTLLDGIELLYAQNVTPSRIVLNPSDWVAFRKIVRGTGDAAYVLDPDAHADSALQLFGVPLTVTNHVPAGTAIVADFNHVVVARDVDASVYLISDLYAAEDSQGIRVVTRYDLGVDRPEAVVVLTTATP